MDLVLYTLSTCIWCKKTKALLNELGIKYKYFDIDMLEGEEKDRAMDEVKKWNPRCSFPSLVVNNEQCIVGFDEEKIRKVLGL